MQGASLDGEDSRHRDDLGIHQGQECIEVPATDGIPRSRASSTLSCDIARAVSRLATGVAALVYEAGRA
jgi:hypothetical protein